MFSRSSALSWRNSGARRTANTRFGQHGIEGGYTRATLAKVLLIPLLACILHSASSRLPEARKPNEPAGRSSSGALPGEPEAARGHTVPCRGQPPLPQPSLRRERLIGCDDVVRRLGRIHSFARTGETDQGRTICTRRLVVVLGRSRYRPPMYSLRGAYRRRNRVRDYIATRKRFRPSRVLQHLANRVRVLRT